MRRLAVLLGCVLAVSAVTSAAASPRSPARAALSRSSIHNGSAIIELVNFGEDDHDLALRRVGGTRTYRIGIVHPGTTGELDARLRPGRFTLWCTLAGHRGRGMRATLRVV